MELTGAVIHSGTELLPVQTGWVRAFHQDRRTPWAETRVGEAARRRKPPLEVIALVGTGRLWVAKGEFEILNSDARRHAKGQTMRLEVRGLKMYVSHLKASPLSATDSQRWVFAALFEPTPAQLQFIQTAAAPVAAGPAKPASDKDSLLDFLRELAYPEDESAPPVKRAEPKR
jgi:hypothetical protein